MSLRGRGTPPSRWSGREEKFVTAVAIVSFLVSFIAVLSRSHRQAFTIYSVYCRNWGAVLQRFRISAAFLPDTLDHVHPISARPQMGGLPLFGWVLVQGSELFV